MNREQLEAEINALQYARSMTLEMYRIKMDRLMPGSIMYAVTLGQFEKHSEELLKLYTRLKDQLHSMK